jgi:plastocyanin
MIMKTTLLIVATVAASAAVAGDVSGKVTLKGTPPPEVNIRPLTADPNCGKLHTGTVTTRHYLVGEGNGLANVFVYVKAGLEGKTFDTPAEKAVMDQIACLYEPYVMGMVAGQTLEVRNSDPFLHNVNFMRSAAKNPTFNFAMGKDAKPVDKVFPNSEVFVRLQCNVHPWMFGYIGVLDHPYYAVTDENGKYTIAGLPDGKYTVAFNHLKAGEIVKEIEVKDGAQVDVSLDAKK